MENKTNSLCANGELVARVYRSSLWGGLTSRPLLVTVAPASVAVGVLVGGKAGICTWGSGKGGGVLGGASGVWFIASYLRPTGHCHSVWPWLNVFPLTSAGIQVFTWGWYTPAGCPGSRSLKFLEAFLSWWYFCTLWRWISWWWSGSFACERWMEPLDGNCVWYSRWFPSLAGAASFVSIGVTRCDNKVIYGSWPDAFAFSRRALSVCTILSTHLLLWEYLGELVTWLIPHWLQNA